MKNAYLETLKQEHVLAKGIVAALKVISKNLRQKKSVSLIYLKELIEAIIIVMHMHHRKEMEIFPLLTSQDGISKKDLVEALSEEHELGLEYLSNIMKIVNHRDRTEEEKYELLPFHLEQYYRLLREHIRKEERSFFPIMEKYLSSTDKTYINERFAEVHKKFGNRRAISFVRETGDRYKMPRLPRKK